MEITLKFYDPKDKMPESCQKPGSSKNISNQLIVKEKGYEYYDIAYYDCQNDKWLDATSWHDFYGYLELENVELWAEIPKLYFKHDDNQLHKLITKYKNARELQVDLKNKTFYPRAAQHILLDQNIAIFNQIIKDLESLLK